MKKKKSRIGRPRKNTKAESTKIVSFRMKLSIINMLEELTQTYNLYTKSKASRSEMLELLITGEFKILINSTLSNNQPR